MKREKLEEQMNYFSRLASMLRESAAFKDGWLTRDQIEIALWKPLAIAITGSYVGVLLAAVTWAVVRAIFQL